MPCETTGDLSAPVPLAPDRTFEFETTMRSFYGEFELYLEGKVSGELLHVELSTEYSRHPAVEYTLYNDVAGDFTDYVCLGATR